jgi:para-aminobenzoate synthetase component 1
MKTISLFEECFNSETSCLLDSASFNKKTGRYTIIATKPGFIYKSWGNLIQIGESKKVVGDPIKELNNILLERKTEYHPHLPPFTGGAIGYISYDTVRLWEKIGEHSERDIDIPDIYLLFYDNVIVVDHLLNKIFEFGKTEKKKSDALNGSFVVTHNILPDIPREKFLEMVCRVKEYIANGDIYQANISQRFTAKTQETGWNIYKRLCEINPSPFAGYMNLKGLEIISSSPERLVRIEGDRIETRPIAGTYPRGKTVTEDIELAGNLLLNTKERAEHIMLVDLERNDLGRVCEYGTVEVDENMALESYSHVHHIVSNVSGKIKKGISQMDVLKAVFPGGTITGCPKIRCMQIIEELEPARRNIYTGCMGWIGYNGNMDLNIAIRTILKKDNKVYFNVGAGIVADSVPEREYNETLHKAGAILEVLSRNNMKCTV